MRIPSGVTDQYIYFVAVDATDFTTRETGLSSFTVRRSRNGGASAAYTTPTINETDSSNMPGVYELLLDEDMTIDSGDDTQEVCLHITHAGMAPVTRTFELYRPKITAGETLTASSGIGSANVVQISGDAPAADNAESFFDGTGYAGTNNVIPTVTTVGTVNALAANSVNAIALAADAVTEIWAGSTAPSAATIADSVWDEDATAHQTQGTFGQAIGDPGADSDTIWGLANTNLDAAVSSRMATYTQPTGFLAATFPTTVASTTNITAGTITTVTNLTNAPTAGDLTATMKTSVNTEVLDVLNTDTFAEPGQGTPAATATLAAKINYLYKAWRNKKTQTSTTLNLFADDTTTVDQKATVSDDGTTTTVGEIATGP